MAQPHLDVQTLQEAFAAAGTAKLPIAPGQDQGQLLELASQAPVVRLVDLMLQEAVERRASDVHIETFEDRVLVRYRIDGVCYEVASPPKSLALAIASRVKILASLDVAESRLPQDGRMLLERSGRNVDLRVSTLPTVFGESIVLRVLDKGAVSKTLTDLGMEPDMLEAIQRLLAKPHGMLLVTGPTGSGKTTTLYACLAGLNRPEVKVVTTEDPVEYDIADFVQVAINAKIELDFSTSLRAILRHDPDIIMVGEIRDGETARVAVQAALTGHMVLSTLHTNDAPGAMTRLLDMGMEPFLVTSTVNAVIAQRLVRRLCPSCCAPRRLDDAQRAQLGLPAEEPGDSFMRAVGCEACHGLGFQGRLGIFELFVPDEATRELVLGRSAASDLRHLARERGMHTLRDDGLRKARAGVTTIEEILRETSDHA